MRNKSVQLWLLAILYVGIIYATLGYARAPLTFLREKGCLRIFLGVLYVATFGGLILGLIKIKAAQWWRIIVLCVVYSSFFIISRYMSSPEEQIHFLQYGLVGVLFMRAVASHIGVNWKSYLAAILLSGLAGWGDERIQGILPNRYYDVNDILFNILSAFLGLILYSLFQKPSSPRPE